jgi:hypothetical protein
MMQDTKGGADRIAGALDPNGANCVHVSPRQCRA